MSEARVRRDPETGTRIVPTPEPVEAPHDHHWRYDLINAVWRCTCGATRPSMGKA